MEAKKDAFLTRANRSGLFTDINFESLRFVADQTVFKSNHCNDHCLQSILPQNKTNSM
jgi:hypothetical protein